MAQYLVQAAINDANDFMPTPRQEIVEDDRQEFQRSF
jgi:hypothetical protein